MAKDRRSVSAKLKKPFVFICHTPFRLVWLDYTAAIWKDDGRIVEFMWNFACLFAWIGRLRGHGVEVGVVFANKGNDGFFGAS